MTRQYETVIGLEVHIELLTKTKIFCGCKSEFGGKANSHTCPVCTGMPGALPVLNKKVVEHGIALGLATNCNINRQCKFDRKNYFYPDNPQGYQISQLYAPICTDGSILIETDTGTKKIRIHEMHMEEDAGKLIHDEKKGYSYVDYNRSGVPLIEIVSEPDMRKGEEVIAYLEKLKMICQYLSVSDCKLQEGSMRVDVNLSVKATNSSELGTRTEMKNLNSFKSILRAIENERERQIKIIEAGQQVTQETRRFDDKKGESYSMRSKEDAKDYRYFPEPDLQPLDISGEWIEEIRCRLPEFQEEKRLRFINEYGLPEYDSRILTSNKHLADMFEETVKYSDLPKKTANWYMGEVLRILKEKMMEPEELTFSPVNLANIIKAVEEGKINQENAKIVFAKVFEDDVEPLQYMKAKGLLMVSDEGAIEAAVEEVLKENEKAVEEYHSGKDRAFGFLVGQTMKKLRGKGNPAVVNELLKEKLGE